MFRQLHVSDNYGDLDPNVSWKESLDTSGASISDVTALVGHSSGMYAGTRDGVILLNSGAATDAFAAVFTHPSGDEIIAIAVASSTLGYVISSSSGVLNLYSTDWGGTDTNLTTNLPAKAPVELHTGTYCDLSGAARITELKKVRAAAELADQMGIECHAGHGLTFDTVKQIAAIPTIKELNIGHFLIAEAIFIGLPNAISEMKKLIRDARLTVY